MAPETPPVGGTEEPGDGMRAELLLHSLAALREIVLPALDAAGARHVVEVGGEAGGFTAHLARRAAATGGRVDVVDPSPSDALEALASDVPELTLVRALSPGALLDIGLADAYLLDGDHNYATVSGELDAIATLSTDAYPLVVLHDVGWPWARRDLYYDPDALPSDDVRPHTFDLGVTPDESGVVSGGFNSAGEYAIALEEGGPRNGVMTAVDDFRASHDGHRFVRVPSVFGLGFLFHENAPYARELDEVLAWCDENPLLARLEANRIDLYLRVHEALRDLDAVVQQRDEAIAVLESLRREVHAVAESRSVRLVDAIPRPGKPRRGGGLRDILHELADGTPPGGPSSAPSSASPDASSDASLDLPPLGPSGSAG